MPDKNKRPHQSPTFSHVIQVRVDAKTMEALEKLAADHVLRRVSPLVRLWIEERLAKEKK